VTLTDAGDHVLRVAQVVRDDRVERCGLAVASAATVADALDQLALALAVVLLDMELPDGHGADVLHRICANGLPKVGVVTGSGMPDALDAFRHLAPDAVFIKPFVAADLCGWVEAAHAGGR
jgi:CheY-like chemotaxis protein